MSSGWVFYLCQSGTLCYCFLPLDLQNAVIATASILVKEVSSTSHCMWRSSIMEYIKKIDISKDFKSSSVDISLTPKAYDSMFAFTQIWTHIKHIFGCFLSSKIMVF